MGFEPTVVLLCRQMRWATPPRHHEPLVLMEPDNRGGVICIQPIHILNHMIQSLYSSLFSYAEGTGFEPATAFTATVFEAVC